MSDLDYFTQLPPEFDGCVRLFPLPDLVVFPNAMQPLHIFEPRYCEMLEDALAGDELLATATLASGWQHSTTTDPKIDSHICINRILTHARTDDDRHNIFLLGLRRAKILEELETGRPFRMAQVELVEDVYPLAGASGRHQLKTQLLNAYRSIIPEIAEVQKNLHELMSSQMRLGPITDIVGHTMQFETVDKLRLLGEANVDRRAELLIEILNRRDSADDTPSWLMQSERVPFPPPFSDN